ncbi:MAG: hypothetical protein A2042_02735 [Candidatus Schekmanbacteria bacterium GWA2_38_11]|uniref:Flavin reductase like domain-containing protein n=1 Tax=Candidatus Schekmanbacteria bacterium GWA2_38_11 TaxID=1817876 RepID=A0A1F7REZ9_9BACT|nr:MAG: hypothetical protein A2042_02735 [Candidatus Schekmanbacteria bacterium GWA2_38_11]
MKKSIDIELLWHLDQIVLPFPVTIITTVDKEGRINAAPYSLVIPFCASPETPQILLSCNSHWHTPHNIEATGEFVVNYPGAELCREVAETGRFYPQGVNELEYAKLSVIPSNKVKPPRIKECREHLECRVAQTIRPSKTQITFVADIVDISIDEKFLNLSRDERIREMNLPVYFGPSKGGGSTFGIIDEYKVFSPDIKPDFEKK